jgi:hypothetical protein
MVEKQFAKAQAVEQFEALALVATLVAKRVPAATTVVWFERLSKAQVVVPTVELVMRLVVGLTLVAELEWVVWQNPIEEH